MSHRHSVGRPGREQDKYAACLLVHRLGSLSPREFRHTREGPDVRWICMATRKTSKRTVIEPNKGDRRYVRHNRQGEFKEEVNVGRSLAADRRRSAKTAVKKGQGDRGDVRK